MCICDLRIVLSEWLACFNVSIGYVNWSLTRVMMEWK